MADRTCLTCKHFEPSSIRRKGWCRNPLLFSPQQSHLVHDDDLDCGHRLGNYWEPADPSGESEPKPAGTKEKPEAAPLRFMTTEPQLATPVTGTVVWSSAGSSGGNPLGSSGGSAGGSGRPPSSGSGGTPPQSGRSGPGRPGGPPGPERSVSYQPEERYWTDYLRIAFPVLGLLLLLGLFWFWATALIDNGDDNGTTVAVVPTETAAATTSTGGGLDDVKLSTEPATTPDDQGDNVAPTPADGQDAPKPTRTPRSTAAEDTPTTESVGKYKPDDLVVTNGEANLRSEPALGDNVVATLPEGTELTVTGESVEADDYTWVPVEDAEGQSGYVAEDLLDPA
jgi:hypothetical protein